MKQLKHWLVRQEKEGQIVWFLLNRPDKKNAFNDEVLNELDSETIEAQGHELLEWLRLAYETLKDPQLRFIYSRRLGGRKSQASTVEMFEADRLFFLSPNILLACSL